MMEIETTYFKRFLPFIKTLPKSVALQKDDLLHPHFLIERTGDLEMYYAPHNDVINKRAKIVIVGITPGWRQMQLAFQKAKEQLEQGKSVEQAIIASKYAARLSGPMRKNLIAMLDACGVNTLFNLNSCQDLFNMSSDLLHTTSVIKYPVFYKKRNYTGHNPMIDRSALLRTYAFQVFPNELKQLDHEFLLIPLGKSVTSIIQALVATGMITRDQCLFGFPHPSGANGHRRQQFFEMKNQLLSMVKAFGIKNGRQGENH
ncbi:hypothetical protein ACFO4N_02945 [Camelliibacillus cellulosilyticus]|uniref:Uracil DNA glycosylase superfamily protein n=1 Tax=Camelliibacillus cellulosilyticus TaxID=2174486 RepID=A0ABV9GIG5_9BACL